MLFQRWQVQRPRGDDLRRALNLLLDLSTTNSSSTSSSSFSRRLLSSTSTSSSRASGSKSDDILSSLTDHEKTGVPAGAGVAGEKGFDLSRMHRLLARLGNPHARIPATVHVVGSKGKGSIAAMVAACAGAARLRVAALTSPHVSHRRERICFGGGMNPISEAEFEALVEANADALRAAAAAEEEDVEDSNGDARRSRLSAFEVMVALGFKAAADRGCDVAVVEAGLGGATDATNVFGGEGEGGAEGAEGSASSSAAPPPAAVVLSSMSLEHASALGGTLDSVVAAKCGVLRRGVPAVLARQEIARAGGLARERVERAGALLVDAGADDADGDAPISSSPSSSTLGSVSVSSCELVPSRGKKHPPRTKVILRCSGELERAFDGFGGGGGGGGGGGAVESSTSSLSISRPAAATIEAELRLFGRHQADNAAAAAAAALLLSTMTEREKSSSSSSSSRRSNDDGDDDGDLRRRRREIARAITPEAISRGLSGATLPGRFQVARLRLAAAEGGGVRWSEGGNSSSNGGVSSSPRPPSSLSSKKTRSIPVVLDGAHTPESAAALARALRSAWPPRIVRGMLKQPKLGIVLACASDKDHRGIAAALRSPPPAPSSSSSSSPARDDGTPPLPPPLRPSVVVFTEVPVAGSKSRSAPPGVLAAAWQAAAMREPIPGAAGRCRALVKASLGAAVDAAARELAALAAVEANGDGDGGGTEEGEDRYDDDDDDDDAAVLVVTGSLHAVGEAMRILPLEEVVGL